jgi:hypothetical protein
VLGSSWLLHRCIAYRIRMDVLGRHVCGRRRALSPSS